ncbi:hypothetical protein PsorP6_004425 [Peronosclerospora sorghi]|uniref:Uncharacterized protein n=1 Tax=Peronosclerospora sorghi TaxID=230839 RepID=A0ACC0VR23_9STRA|nr:hypothetical protein PsorP6_004425 [Peronosclerospora sorghi]
MTDPWCLCNEDDADLVLCGCGSSRDYEEELASALLVVTGGQLLHGDALLRLLEAHMAARERYYLTSSVLPFLGPARPSRHRRPFYSHDGHPSQGLRATTGGVRASLRNRQRRRPPGTTKATCRSSLGAGGHPSVLREQQRHQAPVLDLWLPARDAPAMLRRAEEAL